MEGSIIVYAILQAVVTLFMAVIIFMNHKNKHRG
jgi:hypothetical protein